MSLHMGSLNENFHCSFEVLEETKKGYGTVFPEDWNTGEARCVEAVSYSEKMLQ